MFEAELAKSQIYFDDGPIIGGTLFRAPEKIIIAESPEDVARAFKEIAAAQAAGKWLAGYASYELGYALHPKLFPLMPENRDTPLILFGVFESPMAGNLESSASDSLAHIKPSWDNTRYARSFADVKNYIGAGDCYQINMTFPMSAEMHGSVEAVYNQLRARQPVAHGAFVDLGDGPKILSRSPELFFRTNA